MNELGELLQWLYPDAQPGVDYVVRQDSEQRGPVIARWAVRGVNEPGYAWLAERLEQFRRLPPDHKRRREAKRSLDAPTRDLAFEAALHEIVVYLAELRAAMLAALPPGKPLPTLDFPTLLSNIRSRIDQAP